MSGCQASVMGLPLCHLTRTLRKFALAPGTNIAAACQTSLNYHCPISALVLRGGQIG
jgi:septum formation protein